MKVNQRSVTFINNTTAASITEKEIDLDSCYDENEIVIEIHSAALNPIDFLVQQLAKPWIVGGGLKTFSRDFAGVIIRRGEKVDAKWSIGEEVNGLFSHLYGDRGSLSNYLVLNPSLKAISKLVESSVLNKEVTTKYNRFDIAASWPLVFGTAYAGLTYYNKVFNEDSKILVIGASTQVSNCLVQIAKNHLKVGTVVGICNENSFDYNKQFGYDYLASYNNGKTLENVKDIIESKLNGEKFDMIFDCVGNNEFFPVMEKYLKPRSTGAYFVTIVGDSKLNYTEYTSLKDVLLTGISSKWRSCNPFRGYNYYYTFVKDDQQWADLGSKMIRAGTYKPQIDSVYEFEEYEKAMNRLKSNRAKGKVIVRVKN